MACLGENGAFQGSSGPCVLPPLPDHFREGWDLYRSRFPVYLCMMLAVAGVVLLSLGAAAGCFFGGAMLGRDRGWIILLSFLAASLVVAAGACWAGLAMVFAVTRTDAGVRECFGLARCGLPAFLWTAIAVGMLTAGGYLLLIPGVILTVWGSFWPFVFAQEGLSGLDCLLKSREYVRGRWWSVTGRLIVAWIFLAMIQAVPVLGQIASFLLAPFPTILTFLLYRDLRRLHGDAPFEPSSSRKAGVVAMGLAGIVGAPLLLMTLAGGTMALLLGSMKTGLASGGLQGFRPGVTAQADAPESPARPAAGAIPQGNALPDTGPPLAENAFFDQATETAIREAYEDYRRALASGQTSKVRELLAAQPRSKVGSGPLAGALLHIAKSATPDIIEITQVQGAGARAVLTAQGPGVLGRGVGTVEMVFEDGGWKVLKESWEYGKARSTPKRNTIGPGSSNGG